MEYTFAEFECCNLCQKADNCRKNFQKMLKCQKKLNETWKEQEEYYYSDEDYDDECREIFDRYRCKGCRDYDNCFYAECADEAYWKDQQHPVREGAYVASETKEIISSDDLPF